MVPRKHSDHHAQQLRASCHQLWGNARPFPHFSSSALLLSVHSGVLYLLIKSLPTGDVKAVMLPKGSSCASLKSLEHLLATAILYSTKRCLPLKRHQTQVSLLSKVNTDFIPTILFEMDSLSSRNGSVLLPQCRTCPTACACKQTLLILHASHLFSLLWKHMLSFPSPPSTPKSSGTHNPVIASVESMYLLSLTLIPQKRILWSFLWWRRRDLLTCSDLGLAKDSLLAPLW